MDTITKQDRITLKDLRVSDFASDETLCFTAIVVFDGTPIAEAHNGGNGGSTFLRALDGKKALLAQAEAFAKGSDHTIFLDIFGSREDPIEGVTTQLILDRLPKGASFDFEPDWDAACRLAVSRARPGDIVLTMSTGDLYQIVPQLLAAKRAYDEGHHGSA